MAENSAVESSARRAAYRLGWRLEKSRCRNLHFNDKGLWQIVNTYNNIVIGGVDYDLTLDDCLSWIDHEEVRKIGEVLLL